MYKKFTHLLVVLFCFSLLATAQQNNAALVNEMNILLITEKEHLPKLTFDFKVDSVATEQGILKAYFNISKVYTKGSLPADYLEMLPELLMQFAAKTQSKSVVLLAKEQHTNLYKTLDYFSNHPTPPVYTPVTNNDPFEARTGINQSLVTKVFPGGSASPLPTGALAGKTVWLSPGHGWHNTGSGYVTQRGTTNEIVEDFTTIESIDNYLINYLYNAGANVWSVRERDVNSNEIIVDNDVPSSGYSETGSWSTGSIAGYGGTYRVATANAAETATAIYVPNVTQSGLYWVSVRCIAGANRATDVTFTIIHSGDTSVVKVNQEIHSDTWVYVGQFYFTSGSINKITISNKSLEAGQAIIADAVRLGGGVGDKPDCINSSQGVSGKARYDESARQYAQFQKYPTCTEDVTVRPKYTEYELSKGAPTEITNAVYIAWHTNAGGGTGTESYIYDGTGSGRPNVTAGSADLRNYIHNQLIADIRAGWKSTWTDRGVKTANFGELRELNTIPGTLIELAFHDLAADATELKHPEFRRLAARSIYKGILKFFNNRDGIPLVFLPEQPTNVIAKNIGNNNIQLSWIAPVTGGINGDAATGYKVYVSTNGKSFKDGISVNSGTSFTFTGNAQTTYYFKISATNAGGESFASSVVAARTPASGVTSVPYLIVDAFDRIDAGALIPKVESAALGTVKRIFLERMNRYDYMIEHAQALSSCNNMAFDGCQNEAVIAGTVLLSFYQAVDWFTGEESTTDKSVDATERTLIKAYLDGGGNLLISGSEIGWDVGRAASTNADLDFYNNYLKASFIGDDAGTYTFTGTPTLFNSQNGTFDNSTAGYYDVDFPDRVAANGGSSVALNYTGGTADGAAVGYKGTFNILYFSFPFEAITSAIIRNNLMCNAVAYLTPSVLPATGLNLSGKNNGTYNTIEWITKAELNIKEMIVQRSTTGILFDDISPSFSSKGSWNAGASYIYKDVSILASGYYRIKVIDVDGKVSFSNTIFIKTQKNSSLFTLLTNPALTDLRIAVSTGDPIKLVILNSLGQIVYKENFSGTVGSVLSIPVQYFSKGMYNVQMVTNKQYQMEKVIIQ